jgi:hypothetical protein
MKNFLILVLLSFGIFFIVKNEQIFSLRSNSNNADCKIKGNISISNRKKIYHLPNQKDYENTKIRPEYGERWFCSEQEAINAGWVKAPR